MGHDNYLPFTHPNVTWVQLTEAYPFGKSFGIWYSRLMRHIFQIKPDVIITWANPRYLSYWVLLLIGRLSGIPVYSRGHGLVKKINPSLLHRLMFKTMINFSTKYICYTSNVKESLEPLLKDKRKLVVDNNTLENDYPVLPDQKTGGENGIFFIGRVRPGCGVELLVQAIEHLHRKPGFDMELHIIGDGPLGEYLQECSVKYDWFKYYGKLFDQKVISEISHNCRFGCGPGFMGLNVVHMMSLSLPVLTHRDFSAHMGPEPIYVVHEKNGWLVDQANTLPLIENAILELWKMPVERMQLLQTNAFRTYVELSNPPYHIRLLSIIGL
jgi:glycosyltransferase involved in cell wall biosynthesis